MSLIPTNGAKIYIGEAKAFTGTDFVASDFTSGSPVWTEIKGSTNLGAIGGTKALITSEVIDSKYTRKAVGTRNSGGMQVVFDRNPADAGQIALIAANNANPALSHAFRIEFNDAPEGGTPSTRYFVAFVMSAEEQLNSANNQIALNSTLEIDGNVVPVAAAA
ncbi:MAG: hypothetical protein J0I48_15430 [Devosia sp.]|uniref:hypothetical protein n=1 Tax=Devosia sp. 66-22 TaxID=1895753 RepID=UPI0009288091|nr:hypothetical protein [Devosia sp. 66-22]MBN9347562.1 hypothetical protein [Devosia sp.]OJX50677.1 MAG: hypothetical protein BGO81_20730 [Devosia sp. 66-22]